MKLKLVKFPDERLRIKSEPVEAFGEPAEELGRALVEMMKEHRGLGFAAIQGGVALRMFAMECEGMPEPGPMVLCNPEVLEAEGLREGKEGCLSIPGIAETLKRSEKIRCAWTDPSGERKEGWFSEIAAICVQHELDHLDGKLMFDRLSKLKADRAKTKYAKSQEMARRAEKGRS